MKLFKLFFLSIVTIAVAPYSSLAQMQTYRSNNMSGPTRVSNGEGRTSEKINRVTMLDGQVDNQIVNFSTSSEGIEGPANELMRRQLEKQISGKNSLNQRMALESTENEDGEPISISSSSFIIDDQFSITGTVSITEYNFDMTEMTEEEILIERREAFSSTSNTQSFSTGTGFSGAF